MSQQLSFFGRPQPQRLPPLIGYNLGVYDLNAKEKVCTYRMARSFEEALDMCLEEFPPDEGYIMPEIRNCDTGAIRKILPNEYIGKDGKIHQGINNLSSEMEEELRLHVSECTVCLQDCDGCWALYINIGHDEYIKVLVSLMK